MSHYNDAGTYQLDIEALRRELLNEIYAGAFGGGIPEMLVDEDRIRRAGAEELIQIARQYGIIRG